MAAGGGGQVGGGQVASGRGKAEDGGVAGHGDSDRPGLCLGVEVGALKVLTEHVGEWLQECFSPSSGYLFEGPGRPPSVFPRRGWGRGYACLSQILSLRD